jgi:hypothetical protein
MKDFSNSLFETKKDYNNKMEEQGYSTDLRS